MTTPARRTAFGILLRVETQASYATELLNSRLTAGLSSPDAGLCTELVLGTLRRQGTLDFMAQHFARGQWAGFDPEVRVALRMGLYQLRFLRRMPARAALYETVELVKAAGKRSAAGLVNAVLRQGAEAELASLRPAAMPQEEWMAIECSHPRWLLDRWRKRFGPLAALSLAEANNQTPVTFLRLDPVSGTFAELEEQLCRQGVQIRPGNFLKQCRAVVQGNIGRAEPYCRGEVTTQDEASQMVAHLLDVQEGDRVLDLCAAPGNKTMQLASWAGKSGWVLAGDLHRHRLAAMLPRLGNQNIRLAALDGTQPLPFRTTFDRILVDAPCSGTGTLQRHPEIRWRLAPKDIPALAEKQLRLLRQAAAVLSVGGRMVYSTCSLEEEENRAVVEAFLRGHPEFRWKALPTESERLRPFFFPSAGWILEQDFLETFPARDGTDGFFAAILLKTAKSRKAKTE